ncbi:elongation factor Ts [Buchnera aphidicola str. Ak (Acyrthosiphon kondoi)]|uniref:Elongation factor Ts n=1 Tax=Buchnera aphidicola str. Ak (Acyrthosiphon kondoi) TaxID=1005090 RepID=G2LMV0_9GAMM|nr:translation elongation factor Ts [Buchnera aphidicola]AEO08588.1 elongation factor Ts [Buchnera aphidicola str. Ak (Acyrthosiphon kondoi)]
MTNTNIDTRLIKELRSRTGAGFLECKRALLEENKNIESAIDNLRKSGKLSAEKKINNITNQGAIFSQIKNNIGVMLELNCETDFVSKDDLFISLGKDILSKSLEKKIKDIDQLKDMFESKRTDLVLKVGENISISRFYFMQGENIVSYLHGIRIGVLVSASPLNERVLKNIAMHIAASKPEYLHPENVSSTVFKREYQIQLELANNLNKPPNLLKKIIDGRMKKFINNISLTGQNFIMDPTKTVGDILNENNSYIISFVRFELGEAIFE